MVKVTATELKTNLSKYLKQASREDIIITKNGMDVALLTAPNKNVEWVEALSGVIANESIDLKQVKAERIIEKYESLH